MGVESNNTYLFFELLLQILNPMCRENKNKEKNCKRDVLLQDDFVCLVGKDFYSKMTILYILTNTIIVPWSVFCLGGGMHLRAMCRLSQTSSSPPTLLLLGHQPQAKPIQCRSTQPRDSGNISYVAVRVYRYLLFRLTRLIPLVFQENYKTFLNDYYIILQYIHWATFSNFIQLC